jgi:hypothetical protein
MQLIDSALARRHGSTAPTPLVEAYAHFRLDRQAIPCSKATMLTYEYTLGAFLRWVAREHPEVRRFEDLDVWWSASTARRWPSGLARTGRR